MAALALFFVVNLDFLLTAEHSLLKGDADCSSDIGALHGAVSAPASRTAAAENIAENVAEDISHICAAKIKAAESSSSASGAAVKCGMAELVILLTLLGIAQDTVGLGCFLKFLRSSGISGICVRMVFLCQYAVCFFYGGLVSVLGNAQNLVIISLFCHNNSPLILSGPEMPCCIYSKPNKGC